MAIQKAVFCVRRNKNHDTEKNPDRSELVLWGVSYETAISDPKTNTELWTAYQMSVFCEKRVRSIIIGVSIYLKTRLLNMMP